MSLFDVIVLALGASGSAWLWSKNSVFGLIVALVVGHFFLFCNVFRIARDLELGWACIFIISTLTTLKSYDPSRITMAVPSIIAAVIVIGLELRKPSYHGIGWRRINPNLREWWEANHQD